MGVRAVAASVTLLTSSSALAAGLDVDGWLEKPGVKLLAVEFYATWCKPCMEAVPKWKALHEKYRKQAFAWSSCPRKTLAESAWPEHHHEIAVGLRRPFHAAKRARNRQRLHLGGRRRQHVAKLCDSFSRVLPILGQGGVQRQVRLRATPLPVLCKLRA
ncbi:MAG: hypothetical protein HY791_17615 [Deltaproteobacteria bacterium]|nr:hypothetical protein [Deltaproteobacteria bacterium]